MASATVLQPPALPHHLQGWTEGPHLASQSLLGRQPLHRSLGCAHPARWGHPLPCSRGWGLPSLSCNGDSRRRGSLGRVLPLGSAAGHPGCQSGLGAAPPQAGPLQVCSAEPQEPRHWEADGEGRAR